MFGRLRSPGGGFTLLAIGVACLALAGLLTPVLLAGTLGMAIAAGLALTGIGFIAAWWRERRRERYDLGRLWAERLPAEEEPYEDTVPEGEESSPYCGCCDEVYAPGTRRCFRCGRELG